MPDKKKRKIGDTSLLDTTQDIYKQKESVEAFLLNEAIERNKNLVELLDKLIREVPNTHKNIKEVTKKMVLNNKQFERESVAEWLKKHSFEPVEKATFDQDTQTSPTEKKKETKEMSTQTEPWHGAPAKETLKSLEGIEELEQYRQIENMRWEQDLFKQTESTVGNPLTTDDQTTKVVLVEHTNKEMNSSIQRLYRDKFPELTSIKDEFEVIEQITKIKSEHEGTKLSTKKIIKVQHDGNTKDIWEKLKRIREETLTDERVA